MRYAQPGLNSAGSTFWSVNEWIFRVPFQCWGLYGDEGNSREWNEFSICPQSRAAVTPEVTPTGQQGFMREEVQGELGPAWRGLSHRWFEEDLPAAKQAPQAVGTVLLGHCTVY